MAGKSFFIDTTRCTACRGCQAACKQWNQNPATKTTQQAGTYQNPPDLNASTFKLVQLQRRERAGQEPRVVLLSRPMPALPVSAVQDGRRPEGARIGQPGFAHARRHLQSRGEDVERHLPGDPRELSRSTSRGTIRERAA